MARERREKALRSVRPNVGLEAAFRRRLRGLIEQMHKSVLYWVSVAYREDPPAISIASDARVGVAAGGAGIRIAQDTAAANLQRAVADLRKRWERNFDEAAPRLAEYFGTDIEKRSTAALKRILRNGGFSVKLAMTPELRDVLQATIAQQVGLIRSIPQKYLGDVEGAVMRSVQTGRDLAGLTAEIEHAYGLTRKRAALIARDQNNKATGALVRARQQQLGIEDAVWMHSHAGKEPRPTHVKMDGKRFKVAEGIYDSAEGRNVHPGELINCRCTARPILPGLTA